MLFNTYTFIFAFLPVTLLVFYALGERGRTEWAMGWLVLVSLFFYGFWNLALCGPPRALPGGELRHWAPSDG